MLGRIAVRWDWAKLCVYSGNDRKSLMKITLTVFPKDQFKQSAKKLAANKGVKSERVRDARGKVTTVRTLDLDRKSFGRDFGLIFQSNIKTARAAKSTSASKRQHASRKKA